MSSDTGANDGCPDLRVLVVEDEYLVSLVLEDMLDQLGHRMVGPVSDVAKAVEAARREAIDVAILDVNLNGSETYPVAAILRERGVPFLFATGYGRQTLREPYSDAPILKKPFEQGDLEAALAHVRASRGAAPGEGEAREG